MRRVSSFPVRGPVQHFAAWLIICLASLVESELFSKRSIAFATGLACLGVVLAMNAASSRRPRDISIGPIAYGAFTIPFIGLLAVHGAYLRSSGPLKGDAVRSVAQSDLTEALGYLLSELTPQWIIAWIIYSLLLLATFPGSAILSGRRPWRRRSLAALALAGVVLLAAGRQVVMEPFEIVQNHRAGVRAMERAMANRRRNPPPPIQAGFDGNLILIMGESVSRHHMTLYGYPRETTPALGEISHELAIFRDVIAPASNTIGSLISAFTLGPGTDESRWTGEGSWDLLTLARAGGFRTTWLSNQNEFGVWDNPVRVLAGMADEVQFHERSLGRYSRRHSFDEAMLPNLDVVLARRPGQRKLIVLHMMSAHLPYCHTRPSRFDVLDEDFGPRLYGNYRRVDLLSPIRSWWPDPNSLDCYDNSIRHVDWFARQVIERARRQSRPTLVVYVSDHGEAPLLGTGHDRAQHSSYQLEVPLLAWGNNAYRARYARQWQQVLASRSRPFSSSLLSHSLGGLLDLRTPLIRQADNLFGPGYRDRSRTAFGGEMRYDVRSPGNDYRENTRVFARKLGTAAPAIWAHRINSLGALLEAKQQFRGIEIDLVFDAASGRFRVRHPPAPDTGLTLEEMLRWSRDVPNLRLWLDWKNPSPGNLRAALDRLDALDRDFALRERTLIETPSIAVFPEVALISRRGFLHGYYLPTDAVLAALRRGQRGEIAALGRGIRAVLMAREFRAVTFDARLQPFVDAELGTFLAARRIRRFSWDTTIDSGDANADPAATAATVRARGLTALLVTFPSVFRN